MYPSYCFSNYNAQCFRIKIIIRCRSESFSAIISPAQPQPFTLIFSSPFVNFGQLFVSNLSYPFIFLFLVNRITVLAIRFWTLVNRLTFRAILIYFWSTV